MVRSGPGQILLMSIVSRTPGLSRVKRASRRGRQADLARQRTGSRALCSGGAVKEGQVERPALGAELEVAVVLDPGQASKAGSALAYVTPQPCKDVGIVSVFEWVEKPHGHPLGTSTSNATTPT